MGDVGKARPVTCQDAWQDFEKKEEEEEEEEETASTAASDLVQTRITARMQSTIYSGAHSIPCLSIQPPVFFSSSSSSSSFSTLLLLLYKLFAICFPPPRELLLFLGSSIIYTMPDVSFSRPVVIEMLSAISCASLARVCSEKPFVFSSSFYLTILPIVCTRYVIQLTLHVGRPRQFFCFSV